MWGWFHKYHLPSHLEGSPKTPPTCQILVTPLSRCWVSSFKYVLLHCMKVSTLVDKSTQFLFLDMQRGHTIWELINGIFHNFKPGQGQLKVLSRTHPPLALLRFIPTWFYCLCFLHLVYKLSSEDSSDISFLCLLRSSCWQIPNWQAILNWQVMNIYIQIYSHSIDRKDKTFQDTN